MTEPTHPVELQYTGEGFAERIITAARAAGIETLSPAALAPADEFHTGGIHATRELAALASFAPGARVLDIGSGLGGPARTLAAEFGCDVTGIDITAEFVRSARVLTEACGLSETVRFVEGDALNLPFPGESFDAAWTQHVVMNIKDRATLYAGIARVLTRGGMFAFFDILQGPNGVPLDYPLPWARDPSISFLYSQDETRAFLENAGFEVLTWNDVSATRLPVLGGQAMAQSGSGLNLQIVLGDDMGTRIGNVAKATANGRLACVQAVLRKR